MKISIKQYSQTLFELTDGKSEQEVLDVVKNFAEQLRKDGQLRNAGKIMEKYSEIHDTANGIVNAQVVSSRDLDAGVVAKISDFVKEKYSANKVIIENIVDKNIKGGVILKVGNEILDGSIKMQLNKLKKVLHS